MQRVLNKFAPFGRGVLGAFDVTGQQALLDAGFFAALVTEEGYVSFCVTERRTREEIDAMLDVIRLLG